MKKHTLEEMDDIGMFFFRLFPYFVFIATAVVGLLIVELGNTHKIKVLSTIGMFVAVSSFFTNFAARTIVQLMRENKSLGVFDATTHVFYSYLLFLSFIPIIGRPITRYLEGKKQNNPFTSNEE